MRTFGFCVAASVLLASGCRHFGREQTFGAESVRVPERQALAGSAHVAIVSIAPWEEYAQALQPLFPMDEERAMREILPTTLATQSDVSEAFRLGLRAALPTVASSASTSATSSTVASATKVDALAVDSTIVRSETTSAATTSKAPGDLSSVSASSPQALPSTRQPAASVLDTPLGADPFARYAAATALFQEVRALQRYVHDAIVGPQDRAVVVRLQVTLHPAQRNLPLDAYTTLSFFPAEGPGKTFTTLAFNPSKSHSPPRGIRVVPLIATDNLEGAAASAASATLQQYTLDILGSLGGAALGADAGQAAQRLRSLVGKDVNSVFSSGQLSANTLRVRIGASNQPTARLGLVPRNHTVTVLVVFPRSPDVAALRVASKTEFINGNTGKKLRQQSLNDLHQRIDDALKLYGINISEDDPMLLSLFKAVQEGDPSAFGDSLMKVTLKGPAARVQKAMLTNYKESIWMDVASALSSHAYGTTTAELPGEWKPFLEQAGSAALAVDDGKTMTVVVPGARTFRGVEVSATAKLVVDSVPTILVAQATTVDARGQMTVVFRSPKSLGLCADAKKCSAPLQVCPNPAHRRAPSDCSSVQMTYSVPPDSKEAGLGSFSLIAGAKVVTATRSQGSLVLLIEKNPKAPVQDSLSVTVQGADIVGMRPEPFDTLKPPAVEQRAQRILVRRSARLHLTLSNLDERTPLLVTGVGAQAPSSFTLQVVNQPTKARPE